MTGGRNRVLGLAMASAAVLGAGLMVAPQVQAESAIVRRQTKDARAALEQNSTSGGWGYTRPTYRNWPAGSVAGDKRRARKSRNQQRAKGQHRAAVR